VTNTINGDVVVNSAKYIATISQAGTSDPTVTVLENSIGDIVWTRAAAGRYQGTLTGAFPDQDRLYLYLSNSQQNNYVAIFRVSANIIEIITYDFTNTGQDNMLDYNTIEIRTY
jgi:glucose/arabinose dehydrogenase